MVFLQNTVCFYLHKNIIKSFNKMPGCLIVITLFNFVEHFTNFLFFRPNHADHNFHTYVHKLHNMV